MLSKDYTTELLGLKDVIVKNMEETEDFIKVSIELERKSHTCPYCGQQTQQIHDYRQQTIKDLPMRKKTLFLQLRKRRYHCPHCGKHFPEENTFLMRYQRMSQSLREYIITCFSQLRSASSIARECGCSVTTAIRYFDHVSYPKPALPPVIAIDEFKGNAGGHKFQCTLADPVDKTVLDILASRRQEFLCEHFSQYSMEERKKVEYIVMDMSNAFRSTMTLCFPNAEIVADPFHVIQHINRALETVRKQVQKSFHSHRRIYFKRSRWILLSRYKDLTEEERLQLENMLLISADLRQAYQLKEEFCRMMELGDEEAFRIAYGKWQEHVIASELEPFMKMLNSTSSIASWYRAIKNSCMTGYSNGFVEGYHNKIKVLKRICFGVRNFERFRNRILYIAHAS